MPGREDVDVAAGPMEVALAGAEAAVDGALRQVAALTRELKKARSSAQSGTVRELAKAIDAAVAISTQAATAVGALPGSWTFDVGAHLASGSWAEELREAARVQGLSVTQADDRLVCYPSLVRVLPADAAVEIDRRRERRLRPSKMAEVLKAAAERPVRFRPEPFLDALEAAYSLAVHQGGSRRDGAVVRLVDLWSVLTLLPGAAKDYTRPEFARDVYLLDQSGVTEAPKSGRRLHFAASTGTKGTGVLTAVARDGRPRTYWGVSFS